MSSSSAPSAETYQSCASVTAGRDAAALLFETELAAVLPRAFKLAAGMLLDRQEAEDAVQEAALRAWRRRGNRKAGTDLAPWFLAIVANQCREARRGRWSRIVRLAEPQPVFGESPDSAGSIDLRSALRSLPHDARLVVVLRFYMDLPFDDVAEVSGCSVDAAKSRVRRALNTLGVVLAAEETAL